MARVSIEDCQAQMPNRFALVVVAANRTRQLMSSSLPLVPTKNKHGVTALREIAEGKVQMNGTLDLDPEKLLVDEVDEESTEPVELVAAVEETSEASEPAKEADPESSDTPNS